MSVKEKGFTLIELLVAIALIAVVVSLAGPSYQAVIVDSRLTGAINELQGALSYARSEAVKKQGTITLCSSTDSATCANSIAWTNGWLLFSDRDDDAVVDGTDTILKVGAQQVGGLSTRLSGFNYGNGIIQFDADGSLRGSAATSGSVIVCPEDNVVRDAKAIVLYISGFSRLSVDEDSPGNNVVELHDGTDVSCP